MIDSPFSYFFPHTVTAAVCQHEFACDSRAHETSEKQVYDIVLYLKTKAETPESSVIAPANSFEDLMSFPEPAETRGFTV